MAESPHEKIIRHFFSQGQPLVFAKGDVILGNEPEPNGVYYIDSGFVKIYSISDSGDEYLHIVYGHGELFPLIWAYLGVEPDSLFYEAISDCTLWRVARSTFKKYTMTNVELGYAMGMQLAQQFRIYSDRVDNLEYKKASERVAYRLLFLASRFGVKQDGSIIIDAPITHELFGNSINLARESVSRQFEILQRENILDQVNHQLVILDVAALESKLSHPMSLRSWQLH